ncbi:MAG: hypothetical protein A3E85_00415 [Gammaproteobacteria bacterium RIFCSPHIGHO2_12_FULL_45_12]|nr:MAG: hypothetical protein A3E85_00415 [Gammaproteobacteria bacterium RIFCSPHIGHO2_12_FULL_45_12]
MIWANIKNALLAKLKEERYFDFSPQENSLIAFMLGDSVTFEQQQQEALSLFATPDEFLQFLVFFKEWSLEKKVGLVSYYLQTKSLDEQKNILTKLADMPDLHDELRSIKQFQSIYLTMAAEKGDVEKVHALVQQGADVNAVLGILFSKAKYATLWWLHAHPEVCEKITQAGMSSAVLEGKDKDMTIADVMLTSKKGGQLLQENARLKDFYPQAIAGEPITTYLSEREAEIQSHQSGFFKPFVHPLAKAFLQQVVRGGMKEAEKMLNDNPRMRQVLLTTKAIVRDHAGRKIEGASLQLALGAKDVSIGRHEEMAEMLERYMKELPDGEKEIAIQKAAQFPEGWEQEEETRKRADSAALKEAFRAIGVSINYAEEERAVNAFKAYLARQKEKVVRTGFHFNDQLYPEALEQYDQHYKRFGGWLSQKNRLAMIKVAGEIECYFTANLAQAMCDGVGKVLDNKAKLSRSLLLKDNSAYSFFHPDLGKSHFVFNFYDAAKRGDASYLPSWARVRVQNLCQTKTLSLQKLMPLQYHRRQTPAWCVMM